MALALLAGLALAPAARAGDWLTLNGTELGRPDQAVQVFGFVQPQVEGIVSGGPVEGLTSQALAPYDGQVPLFNTVAGDASWSFKVHRARLGARGAIPKTDQRVSYFFLLEGGQVALTRTEPVVVTDMSVTLSYVPGARIRVGQFKLPVMEEIVPAVPVAHEFVHFSTTLTKLLLESPVADGRYTGGADGFRDIGVMVFDGFQQDRLAGSYALMVSNGAGLAKLDTDDAKDLSARGELAWVFAGDRTDPFRQELKVGGWWLQGSREVDGERVDRARQGAFVHLEKRHVWALAEVAAGQGALEVGTNPPFVGAGVLVVPEGRGIGGVGQAGVRLFPEGGPMVGFKLRYDEYHQQTESAEALRIFRTGTAGIEVAPTPAVRVQANYELRRLSAPDGSPDAQAIAASLGDRATLQLTARF